MSSAKSMAILVQSSGDMEKIRVCYPFVGDSVGGSHISTLNLIKNLPEEYQPLIVVFTPGLLTKYLEEKKLNYINLKFTRISESHSLIGQTWETIKNSPKLAKFLKKNKIDIVHTSDLRMHYLWGLPSKLANKKHFWHQMTLNPSRRIKIFSRLSNTVLTPSECCRESIKTAKPIYVVGNPVTAFSSSEKIQKTKQIYNDLFKHKNPFVIGFIGSFQASKRPKFFVEIAKKILADSNQKNIFFVLIGNPKDISAEELNSYITRQNIQNHIQVLKFQQNIHQWIASLDLLIAPGINESFGMILVEAMLLQTPVLAANSGGYKEIIQHNKNGFLAEIYSIEDFTRQALNIYSNPEMVKKILNTAKKNASKYSPSNYAENITNLYNKSLYAKSNKKKLLFVISSLGCGGAENNLVKLANALAKDGTYNVTILTTNVEVEDFYEVSPFVDRHIINLSDKSATSLKAISNNLKRILKLRKSIKNCNPDLIVSYMDQTNILTVLATRFMKIPVIISERNNPNRDNLGKEWKLLRKLIYPRASALVAQNNDIANRCKDIKLNANTKIIANPLDENTTTKQSAEKATISNFVAVGSLTPQKGFDILIESFDLLIKKFSSLTLTIYGEGPEREKLEKKLHKLGLQDIVKLPGVKKNISCQLSNYDGFVLSSRFEGQPTVLMEAMSAGLPCVAFDCNFGPRELISHETDGLLAKAEDPLDLANSIEKLIISPKSAKIMGDNARNKILKNYNIDKIKSQWKNLIHPLLRDGQIK